MAVVAQANDDADRFLRSVVSGRPLCGSVMQPAANVGAIPLRDGNMHATVKLLPFGGEAYATFAFVETALLLNEAHAAERLNFAQRAMINPMVRQVLKKNSALATLVQRSLLWSKYCNHLIFCFTWAIPSTTVSNRTCARSVRRTL
jgi:hypothetical protein